MKPRDILTLGDRLWIVEGVFLGALGQESLICLRSHSHGDGTAHGKTITEMMVPEPLIRAAIDAGLIQHHPDRATVVTTGGPG